MSCRVLPHDAGDRLQLHAVVVQDFIGKIVSSPVGTQDDGELLDMADALECFIVVLIGRYREEPAFDLHLPVIFILFD